MKNKAEGKNRGFKKIFKKKTGNRATKVVDDDSAAEWMGNLKIRYEVVEVTSWKVEWWDA